MKLSKIVLPCIFAFIAGCGGGGGGTATGTPGGTSGSGAPPASPASPTRTSVTLTSDAGDLIGQGKSYSYTPANADISVSVAGTHLQVLVSGDEQWTADFQIGGTGTQLKTGMVADVDAYVPGQGTSKPGLRWFGEGRGCSTSKGWFAIDSVSYSGGTLSSVSLRFERHCNGATPALRGVVEYAAADRAPPRQPLPVPADLWRPPVDATSGPGNYVYLESSTGDYVGGGKIYRYDNTNSDISANGASRISIGVNGDEKWSATFIPMTALTSMQPGYYSGLHLYPFHNPTKGGLNWMGEGRGCIVADGWFVVDAITITDGVLASLDMRFEQRCEGRTATLHGAVHWKAPPPLGTLPPATPTPAGSWRPPAAIAGIASNYLYVEGDTSGQPRYRTRHLHTSADAVFSASAQGGNLMINVDGTAQWVGILELGATSGTIQPGIYEGLKHAQPGAGMTWGVDHRGCPGHGWLAIDNIAYTAGKLSALDLRFEQICDSGPDPMRGALHWRAGDQTEVAGPSAQVPAEAWRPAAEVLPPTGNVVYLEPSKPDFILQGFANRYTPTDAALSITESDGHLRLNVDGDEHWTMDFQAMSSVHQLRPGYYDGLAAYPFHNPARGGFAFSGEARRCNMSMSSVIIDSVSYDNGQLSALQLRFEQHCETDGGVVVHGMVRWSAADKTTAPTPTPIPSTLWRPAPGATPASGDYVYLQSDPGDFIGSGRSWLHTFQDASIAVKDNGRMVDFTVTPNAEPLNVWSSRFIVMNSISQVQVGFYDRLLRADTYNPARGGFSWAGRGNGCNASLSWVAIDKATYVNGKLTALHARFEQHCEFSVPALRGEIHWGG